MKPTTKKPKARVMFATKNAYTQKGSGNMLWNQPCPFGTWTGDVPVAVLPCATKKQAQQIVGFLNKTEEERVEEMLKSMRETDAEPYPEIASAIHALIFGGTEK